MRLDMSRPVLITHLAPRACKSLTRPSRRLEMGGVSNSANNVPSKSVEISLIGNGICFFCEWRRAPQDREYTRRCVQCNPGSPLAHLRRRPDVRSVPEKRMNVQERYDDA